MSRFPVRRNTIVVCAVVFLLAVFCWAGWATWEYRQQAAARLLANAARGELVVNAAGGTPVIVSPLEGKMAPGFALQDLSGHKVALSGYRGKAVLINFWATWCAPCKIETPWIVELRDKYAGQGFEVIGIDTEGDDLRADDKVGWAKAKTEAGKFVAEEKIPYPVLLDGDSIATPYGGLDELPTSFFVDRKGNVVAAQVGLTSESDLEAKIRKTLNQ
jgi:cytochrome c biogenesis protein CcmG/thiol:disulfide interchange protein DsbE